MNGHRIAFARRLVDMGTNDSFGAPVTLRQHDSRFGTSFGREFASSAHERIPTCVLLPTTALATRTETAVSFDHHVTDLGRESKPASIERTVEYESASYTGADGDCDRGRDSAAGSKPVLRPRGTVRVVLDGYWQTDQRRDAFS